MYLSFTKKLALVAFSFFVYIPSLLADVAPVFARTTQNTPIEIDLSSSIQNVANPDVTVSDPPNGTAVKPPNTTTVVVYTPDQDFVGTDTFTYSVDNDTVIETETITIQVGAGEAQTGSAEAVTDDALWDVWENSCLGRTPEGDLADFCEAFNTLTATLSPEDYRAFINQLSPKELFAQAELGNQIAKEQVENVKKRLVTMRHAMSETAFKRLSWNHNNDLNSGSIFFDASGGAASGDDTFSRSAGWYINGSAKYGEKDETTNEYGYEFTSGTITGGSDYRYSGGHVLGGALGAAYSTTEMNYDSGSFDATGFNATIYASLLLTPKWDLDFIQSNSFQDYATTSTLLAGQYGGVAEGETNAFIYSFSLGTSYEAFTAGGFSMIITGRGDARWGSIDAYEETGDSEFKLKFEERDTEEFTSDIGLRMTFAGSASWGVLMHQFDAIWVHQYNDDPETIEFSLAVDPEGTVYEVQTDPPDTDYAKLSYGLQFLQPGGTTAFVQLDTTLARSNFFDVGISAGYRAEF